MCRRWRDLCLKGLSEIFVGTWSTNRYLSLDVNSNVQFKNRIYFQLDQRKYIYTTICFLIQQAGTSLRKIHFYHYFLPKQLTNRYNFPVSRYQTKHFRNFVQILIKNCPNIVSLYLDTWFIKPSVVQMLVKYFGPQLEEFYLTCSVSTPVLNFLNPLKLQKLTTQLEHYKEKNNTIQFISENFSSLTHLDVPMGFDKKHLPMINRLKNLKHFGLSASIREEHIEQMGNIVCSLETFSVSYFSLSESPIQNHFQSLRSLKTNICPILGQILSKCPDLREVQIFIRCYEYPDVFDFNHFLG